MDALLQEIYIVEHKGSAKGRFPCLRAPERLVGLAHRRRGNTRSEELGLLTFFSFNSEHLFADRTMPVCIGE